MSENLIQVLDPRGQPSGIFGRALMPENEMMDLLNPQGQPETTLEEMSMAERLPNLEGKTVYLVDTGFVGAKDFMEEVQGWFTRNRPDIKTVFRSKGGNTFANDPVLLMEIKENADAAVFGVGS
ncbi:MAG: hypothetical protein JW712_00600 [Dehalococcoidales bacterium]|nr:hypothetical protein [Dehalococcoidales bacterium]